MRTTLLTVLCLCSTLLSAQHKPFFTSDVHAGTSLAHTDIKGKPGVHAGAGVEYRIGPALGLAGFGRLGILRGSDLYTNVPHSFTNQYWQAGVQARLYPSNFSPGRAPNMLSELYLLLGVGITGSRITHLEVPELLMPAELYRGTDPTIQAGAGYRLYLHERLKLLLSVGFNFPGMDVLDGHAPQISTNKSRDFFTAISAGVTFSLSKGGMPYVVPDIPLLVRRTPEEQPEGNTPGKVADVMPSESKAPIALPGTPEPLIVVGKQEQEKQEQDATAAEVEKAMQEKELQVAGTSDEQIVGDAQETATVDVKDETTPAQIEMLPENSASATDEMPEAPSPERQTLYSETAPLIGSGRGYPSRTYLLDGSPAPDRYYVIGSSLDTQEKAEKLQREMAAKNTEVEILFDRRVNRYRVSFGAFDNYDEALKLANHLRETYDPGTWIIENIR